jgi:hypothetical protein
VFSMVIDICEQLFIQVPKTAADTGFNPSQ